MKIGSIVEVSHEAGRAQGVVTKIDKAGNVSVRIGQQIVNRALADCRLVKL